MPCRVLCACMCELLGVATARGSAAPMGHGRSSGHDVYVNKSHSLSESLTSEKCTSWRVPVEPGTCQRTAYVPECRDPRNVPALSESLIDSLRLVATDTCTSPVSYTCTTRVASCFQMEPTALVAHNSQMCLPCSWPLGSIVSSAGTFACCMRSSGFHAQFRQRSQGFVGNRWLSTVVRFLHLSHTNVLFFTLSCTSRCPLCLHVGRARSAKYRHVSHLYANTSRHWRSWTCEVRRELLAGRARS